MADKWPLANGNWSNAANWNGGTLPLTGDDCFADGKTVTVNQNITVRSLRTTQRAGGTIGGNFTFPNLTLRIVNADFYAGSTQMTAALNSFSVFTGNAYGSTTNSTIFGLRLRATNTFNGNSYAGTVGNSFGIDVNQNANLNGNSYGSSVAGTPSTAQGVLNSGRMYGNAYAQRTNGYGGAGNLYGNLYGGAFTGFHGTFNAIVMDGNCYGGSVAGSHGLGAQSFDHPYVCGNAYGDLSGGNGINLLTTTGGYYFIKLAVGNGNGYGIFESGSTAMKTVIVQRTEGARALNLSPTTRTNVTEVPFLYWNPQPHPLHQGVIN